MNLIWQGQRAALSAPRSAAQREALFSSFAQFVPPAITRAVTPQRGVPAMPSILEQKISSPVRCFITECPLL